jgi:molybdate/tungstate transport system substrate-binding protein
MSGEYINYSLTVLNNAPEKDEAIKFVSFMLSPEGITIFEKAGQQPLIPPVSDQAEQVPEELKKYFKH